MKEEEAETLKEREEKGERYQLFQMLQQQQADRQRKYSIHSTAAAAWRYYKAT